jgi:hypothetical protein
LADLAVGKVSYHTRDQLDHLHRRQQPQQ